MNDHILESKKERKKMKQAIEEMNQRIIELKTAIKKAKLEEGKFPEGRLRVSVTKRQKRYYNMKQTGDTVGEYIPMSEIEYVRQLAQKEYNKSFLLKAKDELAFLERSVKSIKTKDADIAYTKLSEGRKELINPYMLTDELYAKKWELKPYKTNTYMPERKIYDTKKGDKVRSKSEAMLADMFYDLEIPYHYEQAVNLKHGGTRYPDFTLLKVSTREEIYFEHFGLLDDEEYRNGSLQKLDEYRANGIYPGKNLLFTYETVENPLDIKGIRKMIKEIICEG
jgi:hypothetical protein